MARIATSQVVSPPQPIPVRRFGLSWLSRRAVLQFLWRDKVCLIAAAFLTIVAFSALTAVQLVDLGVLREPSKQSLLDRNEPPKWLSDGGTHLLGTDQLGRDMLARLVFGARISLGVGLATILVSGTIGIVAGLLAGYHGGRIDSITMRIVDIQMGFPSLLLSLTVLYAAGPSVRNLILVLVLTRWMIIARVTRAMTLTLRESPFVEAAKSLGASNTRIVVRHILPSLVPTIVVLGTLEFARVMLAEAGLSFLGMGIQPPDTSWGLMLSQGRSHMTTAWWLVMFPGLAVALTALAANLLAHAVHTAADPAQRLSGKKTRGKRAATG